MVATTAARVAAHILLVCADTLELKLLTLALEECGLAVTAVAEPPSAVAVPPTDLIILVNHQDHYLELVKQLRARADVPLLLLTDYRRESDHIDALVEGADLILFRPYSIRFLAVQIPALLRRLKHAEPIEPTPDLVAGGVRLDPETQTLQLGDKQPTRLSQLEFRLLYTLMRHPRQVIPTESLVERVWGYGDMGDSESVRKLVWRLRAKLNDNGREPSLIHTIPNVGYSFADVGSYQR
jgi:DNA-binding response OmpR family regulator